MPIYYLPELNHSEGQKYVIYGTGEAANQYSNQLMQRYGFDSVVFFIETKPKTSEFMGKPVISPEQVDKNSVNDYMYIVTSFSSMNLMIEKLISLGVNISKIIKAVEPIANRVLANNAGYFENICFYPAVLSKDKLKELIDRIIWYVPYSRDNSSKVMLATSICGYEIPDNVNIVNSDKLQEAVYYADIVMVWDKNCLKETLIKENKSKVYCIDETFYSTIECENYRRMYYHCIKDDILKKMSGDYKRNFQAMCKDNKDKKKAYVFGTGPSIDLAYSFDYSGGFNIICNSIVKNQELLDYIKPDLLVFADPVFHFSPCEYSQRFRQDAINVIKKFGCYVIIPDYTVPLIMAHYPELKDRIIGMPVLNNFNFPDESNFYVRGSYNILTMFMLPVASAIAEHIYILGCDGRQKTETYFWHHNQNTQYTDLMKTVFEMHPSFFRDRVYEDYYEEHCSFLSELIEYGEGLGKKYYSVTPSYIPALSARMKYERINYEENIPKVSIIMPAYNEERYINRAIQSVQVQSYKDWELLIIDDNSTDNTVKIAEKYLYCDKRVILLGNRGKGVSEARNTGLDNARGEYITFLDADDIMLQDALRIRAEALNSDPDLNGVYCTVQLVDEELKETGYRLGSIESLGFLNMSSNPAPITTIFVRARCLKGIRFETHLNNGEDWLFISDILRSGAVFKRVDGCEVAYRIHNESTVNRDFLTHENSLKKVIEYNYGCRPHLANVHPDYARGLKYPPRDEVILKRRIGLLVWLFIDKQKESIITVLNEISRYDINLMSEKDMAKEINTSVIRYFLYDEDEVQKYMKLEKESITALVKYCNTEQYLPGFGQLFEDMIRNYADYGYKATKIGFIGILPGENYILYGTGSMSAEMTKYLDYIGGKILYYTDSNKEKWGGIFMGKEIIPPEEIKRHRNELDKIVIASSFSDQILEKLLSLGFNMEADILIPR